MYKIDVTLLRKLDKSLKILVFDKHGYINLMSV